MTRILTSGQAPASLEGSPLLRRLIERAAGRIEILPGGGIRAASVGELLAATGARGVHLGPQLLRRSMRQGAANPRISFASPGAGADQYPALDAAAIRAGPRGRWTERSSSRNRRPTRPIRSHRLTRRMLVESDGALVQRAQAGDREAFRVLVERHSRSVFRLAFRLTGNEHDADEVVQESFIRAHRRLTRFESRSTFSTWLYRITANCAVDLLRARKTHESLDADEPGLGGCRPRR